MIVCQVFKDDCNDVLKDVQHEEYGRSIRDIFDAARSALVCADAIIGSDLLIVEKVRGVSAFDHRVLQDSHDIIAAAFRYQCDDGGQLSLFENADSQRLTYRARWVQWLSEQLQDLVKSPQFVRSVVECVLFSSTAIGYMAEKRLGDVLLTHYAIPGWLSQGV
jgi:hypothetical protein